MKTYRYAAVLFDLDGTLLNTLDDLADAVNFTLSAYGYPVRTREEVCQFVGNGVRVLMELALPGGADNPQFDEVLDAFRAYYAENSRKKTAPYPGIRALLTDLRESFVHVAVVSNKFDAAVRELCHYYFGDLVEVAVGESADVPKKPAPDMLFRAIEKLGVAKEDCVYVGDSEVDVATAKNAGLPCVSLLWGFRTADVLAACGATQFAETVEELSSLL